MRWQPAVALACFLCSATFAEPPLIKVRLSDGNSMDLKAIDFRAGSISMISIDGRHAVAPIDRVENLTIDLLPYINATKNNDAITSRSQMLESELKKVRQLLALKEEAIKDIIDATNRQSNTNLEQTAIIEELSARRIELERKLGERNETIATFPTPFSPQESSQTRSSRSISPSRRTSAETCPHVPGKTDKNGKQHCAKCGQFMRGK